MQISFGGINTGLPPNLVEQLVEAERIPIRNLENRKSNSQAKLNLVQQLEDDIRAIEGSLNELAGTGGFRDTKLISSDPFVVTGSVDPSQVPPNTEVQVEVIQLAQKASAITNGFPDKDRTEVGVGYLSFETDEGTKEVYIDGANSTLSGVAKAINSAGIGLQARIINDAADEENPYRLVIAGEGVGGDSRIEYPTVYFLDGDQDFYFDEEKEAKNGRIKIDGFEMDISDNFIEDFIPGVTIELKQANPGKPVNLSVKEDLEVVSGKIESFINASNKVLGFIQTQSRLDANSDTTKTLGGDSLIRTVANRLRQVFQGMQLGVSGEVKRLNQIGIEYNRNGTLKFDKEKFNRALSKNPDAVESFFSGDGFTVGFIPTMRNSIRSLLDRTFGPLSNRKNGLNQKIDQANRQIERKERQVASREKSLKRQFARLEETMSRLKGQGAQLSAMGQSGGGGGFNLGGANVGS